MYNQQCDDIEGLASWGGDTTHETAAGHGTGGAFSMPFCYHRPN